MKIYKVENVDCEHCGENLGPGYQVDLDGITLWCLSCAVNDDLYDLSEEETKKLIQEEHEIRAKTKSFIQKEWLGTDKKS